MTYRILSLDGGGPWALIQAKALGRIYPGLSGRRILQQFDLAIANSGGSITLAGLLKDLTPDAIAQLFVDRATDIFVRRVGIASWSTAGKLNGLKAVFNAGLAEDFAGLRLDDAAARVGTPLQVIIVAYDIDRNREVLLRAAPSRLADEDPAFMPSLVGAVHASSNAPVAYFDEPAEIENLIRPGEIRRFWDGAIGGYNNPVLAGVIEALANGAHDIRALSLGTGSVWLPAGPPPHGEPADLFSDLAALGLLDSVRQLAGAILDDPPDTGTLHAHVLTRTATEDPRLVRLNPMVRPMRAGVVWAVPPGYDTMRPGAGLEAFKAMRDMPMDAVQPDQLGMIGAFAEAWMADDIPNQGTLFNHYNGDLLEGVGNFSDGAATWKALAPLR